MVFQVSHPHFSVLPRSMLQIVFSSLDSSLDLTSSPLIGGDSLHTSTHKSKGKLPRTKERTGKQLRLLNINFQSSRNKIQELEHLVNSARPDVIIGTETWLNPTIGSAEIMKAELGYTIYPTTILICLTVVL